jgi:hypothetical protein
MKIELTEAELEKITKSLEWYYAYTVSQRNEDGSYLDLANRLKKKEPQSEKRTEERIPRSKVRS